MEPDSSSPPTDPPSLKGEARRWVFDGFIFEGVLDDNDLPTGFGIATYASGDVYRGEWIAGQRHGEGECVYASGGRYAGGWQHGKKDGQGVYTWTSGRVYEGGFLEDHKHGHGTETFPKDGGSYVGDFQNDVRHGQGLYTWSHGITYDGGWKDDKKHGRGTEVLANGSTYVGGFQNGKRHGRGTVTFPNGTAFEEERIEGQLVNKVDRTLAACKDKLRGLAAAAPGVEQVQDRVQGVGWAISGRLRLLLPPGSTDEKKDN